MTIKRAVIRALDRAGSRKLLSVLATWYARRITGQDMTVWYDNFWIRSLDPEIHVADAPMFEYFTSDIVAFPSLARRMFKEPQDYWYYLYKPRKGDLILDIGAGVGFDTMAFSRSIGESGRVISIEAHPKTFRCLEKFCELNHLSNTTCLQLAVVDKKREVYIEDLDTHEANSTQLEATTESVFKIPGLSIDEICKRLRIEHIDLLKMNIEGAERLAVEGMTEMIGKTRYACIACHDFRADESRTFSTSEIVEDFLLRNHFRVMRRTEDDRPYVRDHLHAVNTRLV